MSGFVWCGLVCTHCNTPIYAVQTNRGTIPRATLFNEARRLGAVEAGGQWFCGRSCVHEYRMTRNLKARTEDVRR